MMFWGNIIKWKKNQKLNNLIYPLDLAKVVLVAKVSDVRSPNIHESLSKILLYLSNNVNALIRVSKKCEK